MMASDQTMVGRKEEQKTRKVKRWARKRMVVEARREEKTAARKTRMWMWGASGVREEVETETGFETVILVTQGGVRSSICSGRGRVPEGLLIRHIEQ